MPLFCYFVEKLKNLDSETGHWLSDQGWGRNLASEVHRARELELKHQMSDGDSTGPAQTFWKFSE